MFRNGVVGSASVVGSEGKVPLTAEQRLVKQLILSNSRGSSKEEDSQTKTNNNFNGLPHNITHRSNKINIESSYHNDVGENMSSG